VCIFSGKRHPMAEKKKKKKKQVLAMVQNFVRSFRLTRSNA